LIKNTVSPLGLDATAILKKDLEIDESASRDKKSETDDK